MTQYAKVKSLSKVVHVRSRELEDLVLRTVERIAVIVGATLGPGGAAVLIERQDFGLPPMVTRHRAHSQRLRRRRLYEPAAARKWPDRAVVHS